MKKILQRQTNPKNRTIKPTLFSRRFKQMISKQRAKNKSSNRVRINPNPSWFSLRVSPCLSVPLKSEIDFVQEEEPPSTDQVDLDQNQQTEKENLVEQHSEDELETNDPLTTSHHDQNEIDDSPSTGTDLQEQSQHEDKLADPLSANTEIRQEIEETDATIDPSPQEQKSSNTSLLNSKVIFR